METEEVVIAEVSEEEYTEEEPQEDLGGRRRISAGPIIAIIVVVIILSGVGYYFLSGNQIKDITLILDPDDLSQGDDQRYGIGLEIHITGGMRSVDGTGKLDIVYDGRVMHSRDVKISDDRGKEEINYNEFVTENGVYDIRFSMGGKSKSTTYIAKMVPEELDIAFDTAEDYETGELSTWATARAVFNYSDDPDTPWEGESLYYYSWNYDLETILTPPDGEPIVTEQPMWDYHRNRTLTNVRLLVNDDYMGNYSFSAKLVNNLVKQESPYRTLTSEPEELVKYLNRPPEMGEISQPSRVRAGQEATFTLKATDPDMNGKILYYTVTWDYYLNLDDDDETISEDLEKFEVQPGESSTIRVKHTFPETGTYPIAITCADNGYIGYILEDGIWQIDDKNYNQKYDSAEITVIVTRF